MSFETYGREYHNRFRKNLYHRLFGYRGPVLRWIRHYKKQGRLLDVGCGLGLFLQEANTYFETYGIDISEYALRLAYNNSPKNKIVVADINERLPYGDKSFDIITAFDVLEHLRVPEKIIFEFYRLLKPKGILVVSTPNPASLGKQLKKGDWYGYRDNTHISIKTPEEWIEIIGRFFQICNITYDGLWDTPYFQSIPRIAQQVLIQLPSVLWFSWLGQSFPKRLGENFWMIAQK